MPCTKCNVSTGDFPFLLRVEISAQRASARFAWEFCSTDCREAWFSSGQAVGLISVRALGDVQAQMAARDNTIRSSFDTQKTALETQYNRALTNEEIAFLLQTLDLSVPRIESSSGFLQNGDSNLTMSIYYGKDLKLEQVFSGPEDINVWWMNND